MLRPSLDEVYKNFGEIDLISTDVFEVEKAALRANARLAAVLLQCRQAGTRIVAVSDTALSAAELTALIIHFHGGRGLGPALKTAERSPAISCLRKPVYELRRCSRGLGLRQTEH